MNKYVPIILAAGYGCRFGKKSYSGPKCLLEIRNKSLIEFQLDTISQFGFRKVIIVVGYKKELIIKKK